MASAGSAPLQFEDVEDALRLARHDPDLRRLAGGLRTMLAGLQDEPRWSGRSAWVLHRMAVRALRGKRKLDWETPRLLFFVDLPHPGLRNLLPILRAIDRRGVPSSVLMLDYFHDDGAQAVAGLHDALPASVESMLRTVKPPALVRIARDAGVRFARLVERLPDGPVRSALSEHAPFFTRRLADQLLYEQGLEAWIDERRCSAVVALGFQDGVSRALMETARRRGIPTVALVHGAVSARHEIFSPPYNPDLYLTWGPAWRHWFEPAMREGTRLAEVGFPRFDALADGPPSEEAGSLLRSRGVTAPVVYLSDDVWRNTYEPAVVEALHARLRDALLLHARSNRLVLKLHPAGNPEFKSMQSCWAPEDLARCVVVRDEHRLPDLLPHARAVVGGISTGLLEAMACGVPVVQLAERDGPHDWDLGRHGCIRLERMEDLSSVLERLDDDPEYRRGVVEAQDRYVGEALANLGHATDAVARVLEALHESGVDGVRRWTVP